MHEGAICVAHRVFRRRLCELREHIATALARQLFAPCDLSLRNTESRFPQNIFLALCERTVSE